MLIEVNSTSFSMFKWEPDPEWDKRVQDNYGHSLHIHKDVCLELRFVTNNNYKIWILPNFTDMLIHWERGEGIFSLFSLPIIVIIKIIKREIHNN